MPMILIESSTQGSMQRVNTLNIAYRWSQYSRDLTPTRMWQVCLPGDVGFEWL